MVEQIAIITDTHLGVRNDNELFAQYQMRNWELFFKDIKKRGITEILHLGDFFDNRNSLKLSTIENTLLFIDMLESSGALMRLIVGNHDIAHKNNNRLNSPDLLLSKSKNIRVYDGHPTTVKLGKMNIDLIPWINNSNLESTLEFISNSTSSVCAGHFEIIGAPFHKGGIVSEHGLNANTFSTYDLTLSGHYHTRSILGRKNAPIMYVRAGFEYTWSDCDDPRGYTILDTNTLEYEDVNWGERMFYHGKYVDDVLDMPDVNYKDKFVRVYFVSGDQKKFEKAISGIASQEPADLEVHIKEQSTQVDTSSITEEQLQNSAVESYVEASEFTDEQKHSMLVYLQNIRQEAETL